MKRARCAWVGAMVVSVVLLPVLGAASIQYAPTEENLRVLAETDKNLAVVQQLLERGVNPNAVDWRGRTAVHVAARHGAAKNLHAILQAGGAPNVQDQDGSTPLHVAIREGESNGKVNVVKALLAGRADPCIRDAKGHTPYHVSSDQDGVRREIDRARGHARACDGQPEAAQTNQATSAAANVGQAENVTGDPWSAAGGTYQDVWNRTLSTDADPWGVSDTPWSQDNRFADGPTDDESAEEADADYTAALEAAMGEAAEQETQEGDYVAALTQLERAAEERRQAELARQRAEAEERRQAELARQRAAAEERRQAELARQRAEAEERRQAAEREAERQREEAEWERQQAAWEEQEERERQQQQETMNRQIQDMNRQIQERNNQMLAAIQRGEDPGQALGDQLLREQGLGEIVERRRREEERRQQEAKQRQEEYNRQAAQQQEEYNRQVAQQQEEYERQRQEAERKAEERRREAERERERQRQAQAEQRRQAELRAKLRAATAAQCIKRRRLKGGFNVADHEIKNTCSQKIEVTMACINGRYFANYPFKGIYSFRSQGMRSLSRSQGWSPDPGADVCKNEGYKMAYIACVVPYTAYFTSPDASTYRCFE